jgi:flagellar M-ring protein FliF
MPGFNDAMGQAKQFWASRTGRQKGFLLVGAGATALLLGLFVRLIGTPDFKPLYTGLEPADAQTLSAQLDAQGIPHQASADGKTISVPADKLDAARLQTATAGAPHSGRLGFELFDKMSWGQTEFDEKVTYQRALEGELERTIQTLADVETARVHLVMPTDSVFIDRQRAAKASVILKLRHDGLSKESTIAIQRLVSGAVDELKPEDVSIIDADTDRSLGSHHDGLGDDAIDATLTQRLIATLEPVVGVDKIRANVNVDYDQAQVEESQEKYDPSVSALLSVQKTDDTAGGTAPAGIPGAASNIPVANKKSAPTLPPDPLQSSKSESAVYGVNKVVTHTVTPAGRILRISAAILVDDEMVATTVKGKTTYARHARSPEQLEKIQQLAKAVIGFDPKRGDSISVQDMAFDSPVTDADKQAPKWTSQVQKAVADYSGVLRPVSLLLLFVLAYLFVLRPVQKQVLVNRELADGSQAALGAGMKAGALGGGSPELGEGAQRAALLKEQTIELIKTKPANTARAVQAWMREEPS